VLLFYLYRYFAVFPNVLRNGMDFTVDIELLKSASQSVQANVTLMTGENLAWTDSQMTIDFSKFVYIYVKDVRADKRWK